MMRSPRRSRPAPGHRRDLSHPVFPGVQGRPPASGLPSGLTPGRRQGTGRPPSHCPQLPSPEPRNGAGRLSLLWKASWGRSLCRVQSTPRASVKAL